MKIVNSIKENSDALIAILIISGGVSFGLMRINPFLNTFALLNALLMGAWLVYSARDYKISKTNSEINEKILEYEAALLETDEVIREYEMIFENQTVELPCVCGGNTFKGLFSANTENYCECEKCKNRYKVTVNFDSVLISEPLENQSIFDAIQKGV